MAKKTLKEYLLGIYHFFASEIWRITEAEISKSRLFFYNSLKTLLLSIRGFTEDKLQIKASALTYYTLFAIVPMLALILAIGKGFGFEGVIIEALSKQFSVQSDVLPYLLNFVDKYLTRAQGGVFVGVGLGILLWSVMSAFRQIEMTFNDIWQVKKSRAIGVQFTTYFSLMLIVPIFIIASSGLSIFVVTALSDVLPKGLASPLLTAFIKFSPYVINWLLFTLVFIIVPNTRVRFVPALIAGIFTGTLFQVFQLLYIKGQVYLTSYNTVYGGFAIIPLLLLWLQFSWLIILLGAELAFAAQNISIFEYENDAKKISRRYKDFLTLIIMHKIIHRFEKGEHPISADELSRNNSIPIRLVSAIINELCDVELINEIVDDKTKEQVYQPAIDINKITVSYLFDTLEQEGSENFKIDVTGEFKELWDRMEHIREEVKDNKGSILIKDL